MSFVRREVRAIAATRCQAILAFLATQKKPIETKVIAAHLGLDTTSHRARGYIWNRLKTLENLGEVVRSKTKRPAVANKIHRHTQVVTLWAICKRNPATMQPPAGYLSLDETCSRLKHNREWVRKRIQEGKLQVIEQRYGTVGKRIYALETSVTALMLIQDEPKPVAVELPDRPLIAADDNICLHERRLLWERNGRQWNLQKVLAGGKRAG